MKRSQWIVASGLLGLALGGSGCRADTIFLKTGVEIEGTVTEDNGNTVVVKETNGTTRSYRKADVDTIVYSPKVSIQAQPTPPPAAPTTPATPATEVAPRTGTPAVPGTATVPAVPGTPGTPGTPAVPGTPGTPAVPATGATGPDATAPAKTGDAAEPPVDPNDPAAVAAAKAEKEWKEWTPPPGLASFPDHAKRMSKEKEAQFMRALEALGNAKSGDTAAINQAKADMSALGAEALPYVVAGTQHASVDARCACMSLIAGMDGKRAIKQVIEVFYAAMPADGRAAWYQVQFIDKIRETIVAVTGQTFITVQSKDSLVQDGLKQYIDWYNQNMMSLVPQLGEKKIPDTDPKYVTKIKEMRALKLAKRDWPSPPAPSDLQDPNGRGANKPQLNSGTTQRASDTQYSKDGFQTIGRDDALKRPQDK